ncbi:hypothetical protein EXIGLDRAFT_765018 [Exidia glandulosa HHB12029]|uniref:Uncharacterized protein n=1 Tax=Exidia glandulosa HHB12029 TaxID=1314781 RepID=A0A166B0C8_EXIGL|nr:hypothetical protein EXIGLDRAFT_765018 [Exidia glandulosa HHB12029]
MRTPSLTTLLKQSLVVTPVLVVLMIIPPNDALYTSLKALFVVSVIILVIPSDDELDVSLIRANPFDAPRSGDSDGLRFYCLS